MEFETDLHLINNLVTPCSLKALLGILDSLVGGEVEGGSPSLGWPVSPSLGSPFRLNCKLSLRPEEELSELLKEKVPCGSATSLLNSSDQTSGVPQRWFLESGQVGVPEARRIEDQGGPSGSGGRRPERGERTGAPPWSHVRSRPGPAPSSPRLVRYPHPLARGAQWEAGAGFAEPGAGL